MRKLLLILLAICALPFVVCGQAVNAYITPIGLDLVGALLPPSTQDIYIAQNSSGVADGSSCTNAKPWSEWTVAGDWVAGNVLHICGTYNGSLNTNAITALGSGTSGHPITIKFETGANLTSPAWKSTGAINCAGQSFITVDGGTNGIIQNTANGDALANQIVSAGVNSSGGACGNQTVQNLTVSNIYIKVQNSNNNIDDSTGIGGGGVGALLTHNSVDHAATGIVAPGTNGTTNQEISFNTLSFCQHCLEAGAGPSAANDGIKIHDNDIGGGAYLWDNSNNNYHHNAIIIVCENHIEPCITNLQIYNNYIHGLWSVTGHTSYMVYLDDYNTIPEGFTSHISALVYNNFISMDPTDIGVNAYLNGGGETAYYNNTVVSNKSTCLSLWNLPTVTAYNNICSGPSVGLTTIFNEPPPSGGGVKPDYNLYFGATQWAYGSGGGSYAAYKTACGCEAHSLNTVNPNLNTDGTLQSGSAAILAATNLTSAGITPLDTGPPQTFGASYACGTGCLARSPSLSWDIGAYPFGSSSGSASFVPASINFGQINKGASSAPVNNSLFTMTGTGTANFSSEVFSGPNAADFSLSTNGCNFPTGSVSAPGTCSVAIVFTPTAAVGTVETAVFTVNYSGLTGSPATITLTGISGATAPSPASFAGTLNASGTLVGAN